MSLLEAFVLGLVQGITEFLPISSSGHLILVPKLLGWQPHSLAFDVMLHEATLLAVVAYFWRDWVRMARERARLLWLLAAGSVPTAVAGALFSGAIEERLRGAGVVAAMLLSIAVVMGAAEVVGRKRDGMERVGLGRALFIGLAQALSLIPGVSRSGITIAAGMFGNLRRGAAARFSFLLGTPIILAVGVVKLAELARGGGGTGGPEAGWAALAVGFVTAAAVGVLAIRFLLAFLQRRGLWWFIAYRLALGGVLLGLLATHVLS
ncbi:MAG: undecaprenyl-diphosphate phosphatase [Chloroflexi bacterium]|nr:undecaprenyl-diphosphate phosphatase [Chloroflexota bacterium]